MVSTKYILIGKCLQRNLKYFHVQPVAIDIAVTKRAPPKMRFFPGARTKCHQAALPILQQFLRSVLHNTGLQGKGCVLFVSILFVTIYTQLHFDCQIFQHNLKYFHVQPVAIDIAFTKRVPPKMCFLPGARTKRRQAALPILQ